MPSSKFSEIKLALGGDYSYGEIKLVQAHLQHKGSKQESEIPSQEPVSPDSSC